MGKSTAGLSMKDKCRLVGMMASAFKDLGKVEEAEEILKSFIQQLK